MVGRSYSERVDSGFFTKFKIAEYFFEGLEPIGLRFNSDSGVIEGTPQLEGNHVVVLRYRLADDGEEFAAKECQLLINPDPRSLWKSLDSDREDRYWRPDERRDRFESGERTIIAASKRGRSHAHEGKFRDDEYGVIAGSPDGWSFIAVADGAGSAKNARRGAELACSASLAHLNASLPSVPDSVIELALRGASGEGAFGDDSKKALTDLLYNSLGRAAFAAYRRIQEEAQDVGGAAKDFSTTLLLVAHKKLRPGHFFASFWVGDGGIGIYRGKDGVTILGQPDGGQYAGQTRFVTMPDVFEHTELVKRLRFTVVESFTALVMMTDGVTDPKFQTDSNLLKASKWDEMWQDLSGSVRLDRTNVDAQDQLLKWLDFWSAGNHDDRTIAILF